MDALQVRQICGVHVDDHAVLIHVRDVKRSNEHQAIALVFA